MQVKLDQILLLHGVFSRLSASLLSVIMLGAIFHVKGAQNLTGDRLTIFLELTLPMQLGFASLVAIPCLVRNRQILD